LFFYFSFYLFLYFSFYLFFYCDQFVNSHIEYLKVPLLTILL
jgi:hypothetical protein